MSDERWTEIARDTASAATHFARAGQLASDPAFAAEDMAGYTVQMAFMHAMQSGHTLPLENALTRILPAAWRGAANGRELACRPDPAGRRCVDEPAGDIAARPRRSSGRNTAVP